MKERGKGFRNLERQHQEEISKLHAAQRGEVSVGLEGKAINAAIREARRNLRYARNLAVMSGDIPPYPKVQQMRKPVQFAEEIILSLTNGNGYHQEDLGQYASIAPAAGTKVPASSLS